MVLDTPGGAVETGEQAVAAFRYTLPQAPAARAAVDIGHVAVTIELLLSGELDVLVGADPSDRARAGALTGLRAMAKGLMVRGLGSATPSVSATAGHRFTQRHHDFRAPNTVTFAGDCAIDFSQRWDGVDVTVTGDTRYSLEVTALPTAGERAPADETPRGWFLAHEKELASIGLVLLVAVPITPAHLAAR
jgi:hypothetical protein